MDQQTTSPVDQYYTKDHEWIRFHGNIAYTGICSFKLTGFKQIEEISFNDPHSFKKQGEVIARIKYHDYLVEAHMPVDGRVLELNDKLISGNASLLLESAESSAWIALIAPSVPQDRSNLMLPQQYGVKVTGTGKNYTSQTF